MQQQIVSCRQNKQIPLETHTSGCGLRLGVIRSNAQSLGRAAKKLPKGKQIALLETKSHPCNSKLSTPTQSSTWAARACPASRLPSCRCSQQTQNAKFQEGKRAAICHPLSCHAECLTGRRQQKRKLVKAPWRTLHNLTNKRPSCPVTCYFALESNSDTSISHCVCWELELGRGQKKISDSCTTTLFPGLPSQSCDSRCCKFLVEKLIVTATGTQNKSRWNAQVPPAGPKPHKGIILSLQLVLMVDNKLQVTDVI